MPHSKKLLLSRSAAHPSVDAWIAAVAARQHGLITFSQLRSVMSSSSISQRVRRGLLHRRYRGVYVVGQPTLSREGEWLAATLAAAGVLSHLSGAALHGVSRFGEPAIAVSTTRRARPDGVRVHTVRRFDAREITSHKGIPVTTVHRLLVDLTDLLSPHQVANVIHEAAFCGRFVEPAVRDAMARAHGRRNLGVLERAIELHRRGSAGTRSGAEDAFLRLVGTEPLVNVDLLGFEVDFHWPDRRLAVEIDGAHHDRAPTERKDRNEERALREAGWTLLRFSHREVFERPERIRDELDAHGLSRAPPAAIVTARPRGRGRTHAPTATAAVDDRVDGRQPLGAEPKQWVIDGRR